MTKYNAVGVVIIMLHLLQCCSTTDVTTMVMSEEPSTSDTIILSTLDQTTMSNNTTFIVSEYSDGYVQNGNPQVTTTGLSTSTVTASVERSEQVANASPTTQYPKMEEMSSNPALAMNDDETNSERNVSTSSEQPSTPLPAQSDAQVSNNFVSSSKSNIMDSRNEMDVSDVDTDSRGSIAEKETSNANGTETQSTVTDEGKPENKAVTPPADLKRAGMEIGEADVLNDDEDYYENFSEISSTMKNDYELGNNGTSDVTLIYVDNTTNLNKNDMQGMEISLLADDMIEQNEQDTIKPIFWDDDDDDISMPPNETTPSANMSSESRSSDIDNITYSPTIYASRLNETDEKTKASESVDAFNNAFGNENNPYVQQQTSRNDTQVPSDYHKVSNRTGEYDSAPQVSESFDEFEEVHLLADDISLDNTEGDNIKEYNTDENKTSDKNPYEETIDEVSSNTESSSSNSSGIASVCDSPLCENANNQTILNNNPDVSEPTGSLPQYTPSDEENISNQQNTSFGTPSGNETPPGNVGSSIDEPTPSSISGSESQVTEVGEDRNLPSDVTQTLQESSQGDMTPVKEFTTNGQMGKKTYIVPMGDMLKIVINQGGTSVSTAPQMPQETAAPEDNEDEENLGHSVQEDPSARSNESIEVLADDIIFEEEDKETEQDNSPIEENSNDYYITTTTFKPYFISESHEMKPPSAKCPFSAKTANTKVSKDEQQRTVEYSPEGQIVEDPYYYEVDPFCLTRHHVLIPAVPVILPQWCFVPDTPDFMCPRYDLGFHIAFAHETQRDMYYRCVYGQAILLKCPNLHYWDDERKICMLTTDFSHYQRNRYHSSQNLYDHVTHHHCQHCRRNFLLPQDLDPTAQCSDRMLLACNTDGTLSVYECPGFYYYDRKIQLRWYADLERCDYPADGDVPWH